MKKFCAWLLLLAMVLSVLPVAAFAAQQSDAAPVVEETASGKKSLGYKSESFAEDNTYQYADDETVRAIVVLEDAPAVEAAPSDTGRYTRRLESAHQNVRRAMRGISYEMAYEFTTLLNGFSCDVAYGDLDKIAAIDGVEAVYIANTYAVPDVETGEATIQMVNAGGATGNTAANAKGYNGDGTVIAILDTGIRLTHEVFRNTDLLKNPALTEADVSKANAAGKYVSDKIPFAYDYADKDSDPTDNQGHGTHVAAIAAGYKTGDDGAVEFTGAAPAAQLLAMKIFRDSSTGTSSDIYFAAMEDAYKLGADVINMSIGAQNGFTYDSDLETVVFGNIYKRLSEAGVVVCVAGGNEYSMVKHSKDGTVGAEYTDYGTVASPSTYTGAVSVASADNAAYLTYVLEIGGDESKLVAYVDSSNESSTTAGLWYKKFAGTTQEYVVVPGAGELKDYDGLDVTGKIALVTRGSINFEDKVNNAAAKGAVGCVICDNVDGLPISMQISKFAIPAISVIRSAGEALKNAEKKTITTVADRVNVESENTDGAYTYQMSDFSNWGSDPMLEIKPNLTSIGGNVYSAVCTGDGDYDVYSGTSMATPNLSGTYANVLQYLEGKGVTDKIERAKLATALLESSATGLGGFDEDYNYWLYSVRKQGAGLANADDAIKAYESGFYVADPLKELGDDKAKTGVLEFSVELVNNTDKALTATPSDFVMVDGLTTEGEGDEAYTYNAMRPALYSTALGNTTTKATYTVGGAAVTEVALAAHSKATVNVRLELGKEVLDQLAQFKNGTYVEGYIAFNDFTNGTTQQATFLSYYGDWTAAPVLEATDFRDLAEAQLYYRTELKNKVAYVDEDGTPVTYEDLGWDGKELLDYYTSPNMGYLVNSETGKGIAYPGDNMALDVAYNEKHIALTTPLNDADYVWADTLYLLPFQLRNAKHLVMTVTNAETGAIYAKDDTPYVPKAYYDDDRGWQPNGLFTWNGWDTTTKSYVPSNTKVHVQFDAQLPYNDVWQENAWSFDLTVDSTKPTIDSMDYDAAEGKLTVTATDNQYISLIYLSDMSGNALDAVGFSEDEAGKTVTAVFDVKKITQYYDYVSVSVQDYATNEVEDVKTFVETGKPATITLVTPAAETEVAATTGTTYTLPNCSERYDGYKFVGWSTSQISKVDDLNKADGVYYRTGTKLAVRGNTTLYAVFANGQNETVDYYDFYIPSAWGGYEGIWALCGMNVNQSTMRYDFSQPFAMNQTGRAVDLLNESTTEVSTASAEFRTSEKTIRFEVKRSGTDTYTLRNLVSGQYLTVQNGQLAFADTPDGNSNWIFDPGSNYNMLLRNAANRDLIVLYDEESSFRVYDNTQLIAGTGALPEQYYRLYVYYCDEAYTEQKEEFVASYYTTKPGMEDHEHTVVIDAAVEPTCTEPGKTEGSHCSVCGEVLVAQKEIPAKGHSFENGVCTVCGAKDPDYNAPETPWVNPFKDVVEGQWYYEGVKFASQKGLFNGTAADTFSPNDPMTRGMLVTVLWRLDGKTAPKAAASFTDVDAKAYYAEAVAWASENGVVNGIGNNRFDPEGKVTREQIAAILYRYAEKKGIDVTKRADLSVFPDAAGVSSYARVALSWAVSHELINGLAEGGKSYLAPQGNATRAQVATILARYAQNIVK